MFTAVSQARPTDWGLRDYGLPPSVWGGEPDCEHEWGDEQHKTKGGAGQQKGLKGNTHIEETWDAAQTLRQGAFCQKCGAWRGCYGLEPTPEMYVEHTVWIFREVRRVLRADGTLWLNLGSTYNGYMANQRGTSISGNNQHSRPEFESGRGKRTGKLTAKDMVPIPWMVAMALQADGWVLRCDIIWSKPNPMPESVRDRPTKAHEYLFLLSKSAKYFYDADAIREPHLPQSVERAKYPGRVHPRAWHTEACPIDGGDNELEGLSPIGRNKRSVWTVTTEPYPKAHFAVFPRKLIEPCILAGTSNEGCCPECGAPWKRVVEKTKRFESGSGKSGNAIFGKNGEKCQGGGDTGDIRKGPCISTETTGWEPTCGCYPFQDSKTTTCYYPTVPCTVLDPFMGSGTTAEVAKYNGRHCIGIELNPEYIELAKERLIQEVLF